MEDVFCPYCNELTEINHDDGYGYEEDILHEQQCQKCEKYFAYTTTIRFDYEAQKANCLNGGEHKFKPTTTYPVEYTTMDCVDCGESREPTESEMKEIKKLRGK